MCEKKWKCKKKLKEQKTVESVNKIESVKKKLLKTESVKKWKRKKITLSILY